MPSERIQRQIDRFLDEAEESAARSDWEAVRDPSEDISMRSRRPKWQGPLAPTGMALDVGVGYPPKAAADPIHKEALEHWTLPSRRSRR